MGLDMSLQVIDPDLGAQQYVIQRSTEGAFVLGGYSDTKVCIPNFGIVQQATSKDLEMVPEGDRVHGMISFWSQTRLYESNAKGVSDIICWHGAWYRIMFVADRSDFGYFKAVGVRMTGF